ncbi:hypothetical protein XENOCAPTIV_028594 [Xenoophorus captivus]|uniref:Secreted protein n=1 Tax=Xenoophorus captivus TaxID=1517983 RepID=A0ABV0SCP9_9TELE
MRAVKWHKMLFFTFIILCQNSYQMPARSSKFIYMKLLLFFCYPWDYRSQKMTDTEAQGLLTLSGILTLGPDLRKLSALTSGCWTKPQIRSKDVCKRANKEL